MSYTKQRKLRFVALVLIENRGLRGVSEFHSRKPQLRRNVFHSTFPQPCLSVKPLVTKRVIIQRFPVCAFSVIVICPSDRITQWILSQIQRDSLDKQPSYHDPEKVKLRGLQSHTEFQQLRFVLVVAKKWIKSGGKMSFWCESGF